MEYERKSIVSPEQNTCMPTLSEPAEITAFLERLLDDGGMREVEPEVRAQMLTDLRARLQNALFATFITKLPEADLPAFNALVEEKAPLERVQEFLATRIKNLETVVANALLDFRKQYVPGG